MRCYKCGTTEQLSKKSKYLMICRSCRREAYKKNPYKTNYTQDRIRLTNFDLWLIRAERSYMKVLEYRT